MVKTNFIIICRNFKPSNYIEYFSLRIFTTFKLIFVENGIKIMYFDPENPLKVNAYQIEQHLSFSD